MDQSIRKLLNEGVVIPAHPLALDKNLQLDEERQGRLTRYYLSSGVGGIAVGVHTTQFAIRRPDVKLLEPVYRIAAEEIRNAGLTRQVIKIAGICGPTRQAVAEAGMAAKHGYDLVLVSFGGLNDLSETQMIKHIQEISGILPVFGFYLQPAAGGRILHYSFWEKLVELPAVHAIKIAPFNRYQTLDVVRAVCNSSRPNDIALYTGNDDNIVADLLTSYRFNVRGAIVEKRIVGGLLGHWAVWTRSAVYLLDRIKACIRNDYKDVSSLLATGAAITDMNAAIFDPVHGFRGSIAGIHEVLRRQGLMDGIWCLDKEETLSPGQFREIERVIKHYPYLTDDGDVKKFLERDKVAAILKSE